MDLKGKSFLKLLNFDAEEIEFLIDSAMDFKEKKKRGSPMRYTKGKTSL